ncbi:MAG: gamma-glutamyl-gamma-aminobutyrate hydrolase family protein [Lawsonibacter sp.]|nr:gamma-glutamyl-gamma-aminobutyrate hydrolase family protein [Lawsonibacter sp.]
MKPIIRITGNHTWNGDFAVLDHLGVPGQEWEVLAYDYVEAVEKCGGLPVILPIYHEEVDLDGLLQMLDGIIFSGGRNTDPSYYGEDFSVSITSNNPYRDKWEYELGKKVLFQSKIPTLGICRGIQILNVAAGGTLYQDASRCGDMPHLMMGAPKFHPTHEVELAPNSKISKILGKERIKTNSFHTMGIHELGEGLVAVGKTKDGLVEVMEQPNEDRFLLAMQFHPEMMAPVHPEFYQIFESFLTECKNYHEMK